MTVSSLMIPRHQVHCAADSICLYETHILDSSLFPPFATSAVNRLCSLPCIFSVDSLLTSHIHIATWIKRLIVAGFEPEDESAPQDGDARILKDLFAGTGIMGALDHAKIEGANDPEARTADMEAAKIAKRAADALRQSRVARQVTLPSWLPAL